MESDYRLRQDIDKIRQSSDRIDGLEEAINSVDETVDEKLLEYYTSSEVDDKIASIERGELDLEGYVKKSDVTMKVDLEDNGDIVFGLNLGDGY